MKKIDDFNRTIEKQEEKSEKKIKNSCSNNSINL